MVSERMKVHVGLAAALTVLIGCLSLLMARTLSRGDLQAALPGSVAPDFSLRDGENHPVGLSELRGNVVIVYFHGQKPDPDSIDSAATPTSTTKPSNSLTASDQSHAPVTSAKDSSDLATQSKVAVSQISEICREVHNPRLKVLELADSGSLSSLDSVAPTKADANDSVRTLIDVSGDVVREYKIDRADTKPTFFVIDPSGVIRYRGSNLNGEGPSFADKLLAPATQPSSCPQLVETLLSTEAVNVVAPVTGPIAGHF